MCCAAAKGGVLSSGDPHRKSHWMGCSLYISKCPGPWSFTWHDVVCRCVLTAYPLAVCTFCVMWHVLYHGLKDKGLESLMVLNAAVPQVPHKHIVLHKLHLRIVFVLLCPLTFCIKVLCTALGCRIRFSCKSHLLHSSRMILR